MSMFMVWHPGVRCAEFSEIIVFSDPAGAPHEPVVGDDELVNRFQTATTGIVMVRFWRPLTIAGVTFLASLPKIRITWRIARMACWLRLRTLLAESVLSARPHHAGCALSEVQSARSLRQASVSPMPK